MKINEISVELITDMSLAKYKAQVTYQGKNRTAIRVGEKGNGVSNKTLPPYSFLCL